MLDDRVVADGPVEGLQEAGHRVRVDALLLQRAGPSREAAHVDEAHRGRDGLGDIAPAAGHEQRAEEQAEV